MLIGDPSDFAIECNNLDEHHFGSLLVWINGHQMGTGDDIMLPVVTHYFVEILLNSKERQAPALQNGAAGEVLAQVWNASYGGEPYDYDPELSPYCWIRVTPGFEAVRSVVVDVLDGYRIIWQADRDANTEILEHVVKTDTCKSVISAFLSWFEKETGYVHRCYPIFNAQHPALKIGRRVEAARNRTAKYTQRTKDRKLAQETLGTDKKITNG